MTKIFCLGDGFAHGHIWPEWPQILSALLPQHQVVCLSGIGAGHEYLVDALLQCDVRDATVIFQWPYSQRFDKILDDQSWEHLRHTDPVYRDNVYELGSHRWWLSSASAVPELQRYNGFYVTATQADLRQHNLQVLVRGYLESQHCRYIQTSTEALDEFSRQDRFLNRRGSEVQPQPWIHYCWIQECVLPVLSVDWDADRCQRLGEILDQQQWTAYDPDRDEQWRDVVSSLDTDQ